jgi:hypothetical protein
MALDQRQLTRWQGLRETEPTGAGLVSCLAGK